MGGGGPMVRVQPMGSKQVFIADIHSMSDVWLVVS